MLAKNIQNEMEANIGKTAKFPDDQTLMDENCRFFKIIGVEYIEPLEDYHYVGEFINGEFAGLTGLWLPDEVEIVTCNICCSDIDDKNDCTNPHCESNQI